MSGNKQPRRNEIDHLKELILKSGFPLQIEISSYLAKHFKAIDEYTDVSTSAYYLDKDERKGRELDIKVEIPVTPRGELKETWPMIFLNLLVECKNIPGNAWVFFKSPHRVSSRFKSTSILNVLKWSPPAHSWFTYLPSLHLESLPITTVYDEFILDKNASNKRDDNLFEAVVSLAKATSYECESFISRYGTIHESLSEEDVEDWNFATIFCCAVVFNGKMYLVEEVEKKREMSLTPVDHVGLFVDYVSGSYKIELVVDIVHKRAFESFAKTMTKDMDIWRDALNSDVGKKFYREVRKAIKSHASKRKVRKKPQ